MPPSAGEITRLLTAMKRGDPSAQSDLIDLVYSDFHSLARRQMRKERSDHTLQPTALVHEAYLRLMQDHEVDWHDRAHFFAAASVIMRRILVDHARQKGAAKRSAGKQRVELQDFMAVEGPRIEQLLFLDEALTKLAQWDGRRARLVEMMYFGGLTEEESAAVLGISVRTVNRDRSAARAWLHAEFGRQPS